MEPLEPLDVATSGPAPVTSGRESPIRYYLRFVRSRPAGVFGGLIVTTVLVVTIIAPWITTHDPERTIPGNVLEPPSADHWFGTDAASLDVFSRVIAATRTDIPVAFAATAASLIVGVILGVIAGYFGDRRGIGGAVAEVIMRILDVFQAFPVFVLALVLVAAAGASAVNVGIAIAFVNAPIFARLIRGQLLGLRRMPFVEAARCAGGTPLRVAFRNVMPNVISPAFVQGSVTLGFAILLTAGLSFVGAGVAAPTPEWGLMMASGGRHIITGQWWPSVFPGLALGLTILGFALLGEVLGQAINPLERR